MPLHQSILALLAAASMTLAQAATQPAEDAQENWRLRQRVAELEEHVKVLKRSNQLLHIELFKARRRARLEEPATAPSSPNERVPDTWIKREINGITYYLVPLD